MLYTQRFAREATVWSSARHPNILEFIGFHFDAQKDQAWLICPFQEFGNIGQYLEQEELTMLERLRLVSSEHLNVLCVRVAHRHDL